MPKRVKHQLHTDTQPTTDSLKPYEFHGLDLQKSGKEAITDCPFCGREGKFSLDIQSSKWKCLVCDEKGNQYTFVEKLWNLSKEVKTDYSSLAKSRGLQEQTLKDWGVVKSVTTGDWLVPGYNTKGELRQLYRYVKLRDGKSRLLATSTLGHQIHGVDLYDSKKKVVYLCEGPWDAMKLWETLKTTREKGDKFIKTKSKVNLLAGANVLAVPGAATFNGSWSEVFRGKKVYIVYDNDHPRRHPKTKKIIPPAGIKGVKRVSSILSKKPTEVNYLRWGENDYDKNLPHGYDIRDFLSNESNLQLFFNKMHSVPEEWLVSKKQQELKEKELRAVSCQSWRHLTAQWKKAMLWSDGLDITLSVMLSSIASTDLIGDQLWVKIIGPASSGKSSLCEAVSVARDWVIAKDQFSGLTSGYQPGDGGDNYSFVERLMSKTLVINDGDTLKQLPNVREILSQLRTFYGRNIRVQYKNKMSKDFEGVNTTLIVCGTHSLKSLDESELGERFLDCVIMSSIDEQFEDKVLASVIDRIDSNLSETNGDTKRLEDKEESLAKQMTGGYVDYLRKNAKQLVAQVETPQKYKLLIAKVAKFVSYIRARPSDEVSEREFSARLGSQHMRLAKCLAAVLNKKKVDQEVMRRVVKVAMDTAEGITLDICRYIVASENNGVDVKMIVLETNEKEHKVRELLRFLVKIGIAEPFQKRVKGLRNAKKYWRLKEHSYRIVSEVLSWEFGKGI